jgi:4-carboxymuconolactone decarboxylase
MNSMLKIGIGRGKQRLLLAVAVAAIAAIAAGSSPSALADSDLQCEPQNQNSVAPAPHAGSQSPLHRIRDACPLLGSIIEEFAAQDLGEAFADESPNPRAPAIATVAGFAALGDTASMKLYAKDALDAGATALDFRELLYLTAVYAGVPKAIEATRVVTQVVTEREVQSPDGAARVGPRDY